MFQLWWRSLGTGLSLLARPAGAPASAPSSFPEPPPRSFPSCPFPLSRLPFGSFRLHPLLLPFRPPFAAVSQLCFASLLPGCSLSPLSPVPPLPRSPLHQPCPSGQQQGRGAWRDPDGVDIRGGLHRRGRLSVRGGPGVRGCFVCLGLLVFGVALSSPFYPALNSPPRGCPRGLRARNGPGRLGLKRPKTTPCFMLGGLGTPQLFPCSHGCNPVSFTRTLGSSAADSGLS